MRHEATLEQKDLMKIFVATKQTQGQRKNDFNSIDDGAWVTFAMICDRDRSDPDGGCGCGRGMAGMTVGGATTTFCVADLLVTGEEYRAAVVKHYNEGGWRKYMSASEFNEMVTEDVTDLLRIAFLFPVGAVLEKRLEDIRVRRVLPTVGNRVLAAR